MRLDKYISGAGLMSRRQTASAVKCGRIKVNGITAASADMKISEGKDIIELDGAEIPYNRYTYIMLNKPEGYLSVTDDPRAKTVMELLDQKDRNIGMFPCGRLDKDSTGLLILTNDGPLAHRLLSPKRHCEKKYIVNIAKPITDKSVIDRLENGIDIGEGVTTLPAKFVQLAPARFEVTLSEGKYHQIKRMFEAAGNKVVSLKRICFAGIALDPALKSGRWRYLSEDEINVLNSSGI